MSYKEKSAWVMCLALMLGALFYGYAVLGMTAQTAHSPLTGIVVIYVLIIVLISIVGHIIAALVSVDEAEAVADERDKLISVRANSASSHILGLGCAQPWRRVRPRSPGASVPVGVSMHRQNSDCWVVS